MNEWISVKESLPVMDGQVYLIYSTGYNEKYADKNGYDILTAQNQVAWYVQRDGRGFGITHWMVLPDEPKSL